MRWDDRIDEMERRGFATDEDRGLLFSWDTCLVGEALRDANAPGIYEMCGDISAGLLRDRLLGIGGGLGGPQTMAALHDWPALRARLALAREIVSEHFPPPVVAIHGIGQDENPIQRAPVPELVSA